MTISLCMIVKNESKTIEDTLLSVKDFVNEIVIVDTGSTDTTIDIAKKYTPLVYSFEWCNDFSKARNFSIEKATSDWILWLDADEKLCITDDNKIQKILEESTNTVFSIKILHELDSQHQYMKEYYISYHHRLFRNHQNIKFKGMVHETLQLESFESLDNIPVCEAIELHHNGYHSENSIEKSIRNLNLLFEERALTPDNPWIDYHIAADLYRLNQVEKAYHFVNLSIGSFLAKVIKPPALLYKLKYDILLHTHTYESAYIGIDKIIELYPDYVELHFYRGLLLYLLRRYEEAVNSFQYCLILGEFNPNYLIKSGTGTYYPYYYIGKCYNELNRPIHAKIAFLQALDFAPDFLYATEELEKLSTS